MLLSSVSSSILSSSAVSSSAISSTTISMITTPGIPQYGAAMVSVLIVLLSLKEILSSSQKWNKYLNSSFNLGIVPLLVCFVAIVVFKVIEIV
jgi:hypothetical protein